MITSLVPIDSPDIKSKETFPKGTWIEMDGAQNSIKYLNKSNPILLYHKKINNNLARVTLINRIQQ